MQRWLGYAEKDAREQGYVSANCTNNLKKLRGFLDPLVEARYDVAVKQAQVVSALKNTGRQFDKLRGWLPRSWNNQAAKAVQEAIILLRQAGETAAAKAFEADYQQLRQSFDQAKAGPVGREEFPISLTRGSGVDGLPFVRESVVRNTAGNVSEGQPEWLVVGRAGRKYFAQAGQAHGVGSERGYLYWAACRVATPLEAEPAVKAWAAYQLWAEAQAAALAEWQSLSAKVCREGVHGPGPHELQGQRVVQPQVNPALGDCFVIGEDSIWHVQANPAEGAYKQLNNVRLDGREAIGHRVPFSPPLELAIYAVVANLAMPKPTIQGNVAFNPPQAPSH